MWKKNLDLYLLSYINIYSRQIVIVSVKENVREQLHDLGVNKISYHRQYYNKGEKFGLY